MLPNSLWELQVELRQAAISPDSIRLFFPSLMRDLITDRLGRGPLPDSFFHNGQTDEMEEPTCKGIRRMHAEDEFDEAEAIITKANECETIG